MKIDIYLLFSKLSSKYIKAGNLRKAESLTYLTKKVYRHYWTKELVKDFKTNSFIKKDNVIFNGKLKSLPNYNGLKVVNKIPPLTKREPFNIINEFPLLRPYQIESCLAALNERVGLLKQPTGAGKTLTASYLIHKLGLKTLFVTPNLNLLNQTLETFNHYFGDDAVSYKESLDKNIVVGNIQSLWKIPEEKLSSFEFLIVDEAHKCASDTYIELLKKLKNIQRAYFLTATDFRNDSGETLFLESIYQKNLFTYDVKDGIVNNFICRPDFIIHRAEGNDTPKEIDDYSTIYQREVVDNEKRNNLIIDSAIKYNDKQVLIIVTRVEHGQKLLESFIEKGINARFVNGENKASDTDKDLQDFREYKYNVLIGTSVISEGTDIKNIDVLINASAGKSEGRFIQILGRALRVLEGKEKATIIDFYDEHPYLYHQSRQRINVLSMYQQPIKVV